MDCFLELSSGYAFRFLDISARTGKYYIDTDLPELIEKKKQMLERLRERPHTDRIRLLPLNALNKEQFRSTANALPPGRVAIINEGLLIYFDTEEKKTLCNNIRSVLKERGGYWITSDIYVRAIPHASSIRQDFEECGFVVDQEESIDPAQLSSFKYLQRLVPPSMESHREQFPKFQTSWRLKV